MAALSPTSIIRPFKLCTPDGHPRSRTRVRCSIAEGSAISPSRSYGRESVECVVVGGGISGLCIAQALATKHRDSVPNVIVTEARDRVGGNITTVERDGYLWEEGPNSFQPSDPILTMAVSFSPRYSCTLRQGWMLVKYILRSRHLLSYLCSIYFSERWVLHIFMVMAW